MFNWRQPRILAILAILGMMVAAGIAAVVWVALTAGGVAGTNAPHATSVAQLGGSSPDDAGSTPTVGAGSCPATDQPPPVSHRPGADQQLVPDGATVLLVCRYQGMDPPRHGAEHQLIGFGSPHALATVRQIAGELNALKPITGSNNCPADDGSAVVAYFRYPGGVDDPVVIDPMGCSSASNGQIMRAGGPVVDQVLKLARPVSTRVATFTGRVRLCGGRAPGHCRTAGYTVCTPKCRHSDYVAAYTQGGVYLGQGQLHHGRFEFNVAQSGPYTLKLRAINKVLQTKTARARFGHTTHVTFIHQVK